MLMSLLQTLGLYSFEGVEMVQEIYQTLNLERFAVLAEMPTYHHDHVAKSMVAARNKFAQIYKIKSSGFEKIIFQRVSKILAIMYSKGQKLLL